MLIETDDLITADEACRLIGGSDRPISKPTFYRGIKAGRYPAPVHPSPGIARWFKSTLLAARAAAIVSTTEAA
jgi:predicted DNA-binding transcriptional regulator AlpA